MSNNPPNFYPQYPGQNANQQPAFPPPGYPQSQPGYSSAPTMSPQQGNFSQPGSYPQPEGTQPPQKRGMPLWMVLVVSLLVIAAGTGIFSYLQLRSTPEKTLDAYCTDFKNSDAQGLYDLLSTRQHQTTTLESVRVIVNLTNSPLVGGVKTCTVVSTQENGSTATGTVTFTFNNGHTATEIETLVNENGTWKFDTSKPQG